MTRGVEQIDFDPFIVRGDILGKDGDATLALQVIAVEDQVTGRFSRVNDVAMVDDLVDQCGFAVVDVCDDGNISESAHGVLLNLKARNSFGFPCRTPCLVLKSANGGGKPCFRTHIGH